ncbi:MAG: hypothetical protein WC100_00980 [Sterolibacterium sp.]
MTGLLEFFAGKLGRWLVIAALAVAVWGYGYVSGLQHEADRHANFASQVAALGAAQGARTKATVRIQKSVTQQTEAQYVQGDPTLRGLYGPGRLLKQPDLGSLKLSALSLTAGEPDAGATDPRPGAGPSAAGEDACAGLKSDAAVTTRMLLFLQDWADRQKATTEEDKK